MQITFIGSGNMTRGIATRALAGSHTVRIIGQHPDKIDKLTADLREQNPGADAQPADESALATADIVVLALPYPSTEQVAARYTAALTGKVVIDIANPADLATFDPITEPGTSAAEQLAAKIPAARIVKAFNTTFAGNLVAGQAAGAPLDVLIASDDAQAKEAVADLATSGGLHPINAGPLKRARALEAFQILHMSLQQDMPIPWSSSLKILD